MYPVRLTASDSFGSDGGDGGKEFEYIVMFENEFQIDELQIQRILDQKHPGSRIRNMDMIVDWNLVKGFPIIDLA